MCERERLLYGINEVRKTTDRRRRITATTSVRLNSKTWLANSSCCGFKSVQVKFELPDCKHTYLRCYCSRTRPHLKANTNVRFTSSPISDTSLEMMHIYGFVIGDNHDVEKPRERDASLYYNFGNVMHTVSHIFTFSVLPTLEKKVTITLGLQVTINETGVLHSRPTKQ